MKTSPSTIKCGANPEDGYVDTSIPLQSTLSFIGRDHRAIAGLKSRLLQALILGGMITEWDDMFTETQRSSLGEPMLQLRFALLATRRLSERLNARLYGWVNTRLKNRRPKMLDLAGAD
jgi:hypothetical protein